MSDHRGTLLEVRGFLEEFRSDCVFTEKYCVALVTKLDALIKAVPVQLNVAVSGYDTHVKGGLIYDARKSLHLAQMHDAAVLLHDATTPEEE